MLSELLSPPLLRGARGDRDRLAQFLAQLRNAGNEEAKVQPLFRFGREISRSRSFREDDRVIYIFRESVVRSPLY
jgi:hypothetical protein